jgi:hypothetical protein
MPCVFRNSADPIFGIERMHFERGDIDQISRPNELFMHAMIAQHVTNILAKETLDALSEIPERDRYLPVAFARFHLAHPVVAA